MPEREVLQDDEHFRVEIVDWQGEKAVLKRVKDTTSDRRRLGFNNETVGTEMFARLAADHPELNMRIPKTYAVGDTWAIREFLDGGELIPLDEMPVDIESRLGRLARLLAGIDRIAPDTTVADDPMNSAPYTDIRKRLSVWAEQPLQHGILDQQSLDGADELIAGYQPLLEPRYAHGDLVPYAHAFNCPDGRIGLIDFEHYSPIKARFYDVSYAYASLFARMSDTSIPAKFLDHFFQETAPGPHASEQFIAVMAQRAIRMHFDVLFDDAKKDNYATRARELLRLCLERDLDAFTTN